MSLDLQVSSKMTRGREDAAVRLSGAQKRALGVAVGGRLLLKLHKGGKLAVVVADVHVEDVLEDRDSGWVSQYVFDVIVGNPTDLAEVTLGCDPEFLFLDEERRVLPANYWLPAKGTIGSDGPLAELRPPPSTHERGVVDSLRSLIHSLPLLINNSRGTKAIKEIEGHSCWGNYALGFHIHIGFPREILTFAAPKSREFITSFIHALDYFVGIPAMLLEDTSLRRLGDGAYGKPGDFRIKPKTVEYRTPGGYHLRHPDYAAGIMALALCTSRDILEGAREVSNGWRDMNQVADFNWIKKRYNLPETREIQWAIREPTKKVAAGYLAAIVKQIVMMKHFKDHARSIHTFIQLIFENKQYSPRLLSNW